MINYYGEGRYLIQKVNSKDFYEEHEKYEENGVISEKLGEIILKIIYNSVFGSKMFSGLNHSVKEEALDYCIIHVIENYKKISKANRPYSFLVATVRNRLFDYLKLVFSRGTMDIYGGSIYISKGKINGSVAKMIPITIKDKNTFIYDSDND